MTEKRYLVIAAETNWVHRVARERNTPVICGVMEMAPGVLIGPVSDGKLTIVQLNRFDHVVIDTDDIDRTSGRAHRQQLLAHIRASGLAVQEMNRLTAVGPVPTRRPPEQHYN